MRGAIIGPLTFPKGQFMEGIIDDTSKPGTWMEVVPGSAEVGGRLHYRHYQPSADGDPRPLILLLEDDQQGAIYTAAYVAGTRCRMYAPLPGEQMNFLMLGATGTGSLSTAAVGSRFIGDSATGKFILTATSSQRAAFTSLEHLTESPPDTDQWVLGEAN